MLAAALNAHAGVKMSAQWAIRDGRLLPEARKLAGAAFTLAVERYDAHPELEGERLISEGPASKLPLYLDVGRR